MIQTNALSPIVAGSIQSSSALMPEPSSIFNGLTPASESYYSTTMPHASSEYYSHLFDNAGGVQIPGDAQDVIFMPSPGQTITSTVLESMAGSTTMLSEDESANSNNTLTALWDVMFIDRVISDLSTARDYIANCGLLPPEPVTTTSDTVTVTATATATVTATAPAATTTIAKTISATAAAAASETVAQPSTASDRQSTDSAATKSSTTSTVPSAGDPTEASMAGKSTAASKKPETEASEGTTADTITAVVDGIIRLFETLFSNNPTAAVACIGCFMIIIFVYRKPDLQNGAEIVVGAVAMLIVMVKLPADPTWAFFLCSVLCFIGIAGLDLLIRIAFNMWLPANKAEATKENGNATKEKAEATKKNAK